MTAEVANLVVKAGKELVNTGLIARTWGNVSCRINETSFMITPSGRDYLTLSPEEIVVVNIDDLSYEGRIKPSSEKGIHAAVYSQFPEIHFVIHTHQESASVVSALGIDQIAFEVNPFEVPNAIYCAEYALPGTKRLKKNVMKTLEKTKSNAVIMKHHGALCFGRDYEEAFKTARTLETICTEYIQKASRMVQENERLEPLIDLEDMKQSVLTFKEGEIVINREIEVIKFSKQNQPLKPYLDDFAQIVGVKVRVVPFNIKEIQSALKHASAVFVEGSGALCWGKDESEAKAVNMILNKNCKAYFAANAYNHSRPIRTWECYLMRFVYQKRYSKLASKK